MIYGYARCSTNEHIQDITRQVRELKEMGVDDKNMYIEFESGMKNNRKYLTSLLEVVKEGDTICAMEVSRITRSTKQLCQIIDFAKREKIKLVFGGFVVDCTKELDAMTEGMLKMMGVFSELERNIISERVKSGLKNAKAKGKKVGRPKTNEKNIPQSFYRYYAMYKNNLMNKVEVSKICNLSYPTVFKYIKIIEKGAIYNEK